MPAEVLLALTTLDSEAAAQALARRLVEARLAACVQVEAIASTYRWEGAVTSAPEWRLLIKTHPERWPALEAFIQAHHPYALPALVAWPASQVWRPFAEWVAQESQGD